MLIDLIYNIKLVIFADWHHNESWLWRWYYTISMSLQTLYKGFNFQLKITLYTFQSSLAFSSYWIQVRVTHIIFGDSLS